jgi:hypothetical protein
MVEWLRQIWDRHIGVLLKERRMLVLELPWVTSWHVETSHHMSQLAEKAGLEQRNVRGRWAAHAAQL